MRNGILILLGIASLVASCNICFKFRALSVFKHTRLHCEGKRSVSSNALVQQQLNTNMAPKLYMIDPSPPVRSVLLTASALGVPLELLRVDLIKGEHLKPEFLKINPQHTLPVLDDDGKIICDSHAINVYLVSKYGKDDSLYPKDPYKQAIVNQRLHFDSGVIWPAAVQISRPIVLAGAKSVPLAKAAVVTEAYGFLEKFLEGHQWAAGDSVTVADFNLITTTTSIAVLVPIDDDKFPNITAWIKRVQALPMYEVEKPGLELFEGLISSKLGA